MLKGTREIKIKRRIFLKDGCQEKRQRRKSGEIKALSLFASVLDMSTREGEGTDRVTDTWWGATKTTRPKPLSRRNISSHNKGHRKHTIARGKCVLGYGVFPKRKSG